ncbi:MAG: hypothetical protein HQL86_06175 [Magnetococcales bacterium]|nr:hypothetical protein [Magnetococcales bacterium]
MNTTRLPKTLRAPYGFHALRGRYQILFDHLSRLGCLPRHRGFARIAWRDQFRHLTGGVQPVVGACRQRAHATAEWLVRAWEASPDDGVSLGYFPCDPPAENRLRQHGWLPSSPVSTSAAMIALLHYAIRFSDALMRERALSMAHWLTHLQTPSGMIQDIHLPDRPQHPPSAHLATGMVLHGFAALLQHEPDLRIEHSAQLAAEFLMHTLNPEPHPDSPDPSLPFQGLKAHPVACAWGLQRFGALKGVARYQEMALRLARHTASLQQGNGWFVCNDPELELTPSTEAIGQTLHALLEIGITGGDTALIDAARRGMLPIIDRIRPHGFLSGRWRADWSPASSAACLTGSAQLSVVCYRLFQTLGDVTFLEAGDRLLNFLKGVQVIDAPDSPMRGALAGSFPLFFGEYHSAGFPTSASHQLLDALLLQDRIIASRA